MADGFAMLEHDHREVGELFDDYEQRGDPSLARQICFELTVHGEIEEQVLYPELREFGDKTSEQSDHAEDAHEDITRTIGRIELAEPDAVLDLMRSLRTTVENHVREEEESIFPTMRELGVDAEKLGRGLEAAKGEAVTRSRGTVG
jgi:hemerythrin superfamily protein